VPNIYRLGVVIAAMVLLAGLALSYPSPPQHEGRVGVAGAWAAEQLVSAPRVGRVPAP